MNTTGKNIQTAAIVCHHVATMAVPILYAEKSEPEDDSDKRGKRAADGNSYEHSNLQDTDLHALEHKYEGY